MTRKQRIILALGSALAAAVALPAVPAFAMPVTQPAVVVAAPGWHHIGDYSYDECFRLANYYHDHYGTKAERCDDLGGGRAALWVLTDE